MAVITVCKVNNDQNNIDMVYVEPQYTCAGGEDEYVSISDIESTKYYVSASGFSYYFVNR